MSMELFVLFAVTKTPTFDAWAEELTTQRAPVQLDHPVDLQKHTGFLPVRLQGHESGFFFLRPDYDELVGAYPALSDLSAQNPSVFSLGYGGNFDECASAFYSAAALVRITGGKAFEPQGGIFMSERELINAGETCLASAKGQ